MGTAVIPPQSTVEINRHLAEILESPAFKTSARSQQFLQFVVEETLSGRTDSLKERVIGERVFGRQADYDTGQDSIVRVKANEVRRRLAQFYEQHPDSPIRIEMASGSYGVRLRVPEKVEAPIVTPHPAAVVPQTRHLNLWAAGGALALFIVGLSAYLIARPAPTPFDEFWGPFLTKDKPLLICMPTLEAFRIYGQEKQKLIQTYQPRPPGLPPVQAPPLADAKIVPEPGLLVGVGDVRALTLIHTFAAVSGAKVNTRTSAMTAYADLSAGPSVIIGGETNQWSADLADGHRFLQSRHQGRNVLMDREKKEPVCAKAMTWEPPSRSDCGVITRIPKSVSGGALLLAAGLDHFGTSAAGELLVNKDRLNDVLAQAGPDWRNRNLQIFFTVDRVRDGIGEAQVKAVHTW